MASIAMNYSVYVNDEFVWPGVVCNERVAAADEAAEGEGSAAA